MSYCSSKSKHTVAMGNLTCYLFLALCALAYTSASVERRQQQPHNTVRPAFSVGLTHNDTFPQPRNVVFDRVFLDTTTSYNKATGDYTVPVTGEYVVMFHAVAEYDGQISLSLKRGDDLLLSAYAHTQGDYASTGNVGVFHLAQGDVVHVVGKGDSFLYAYSSEVYCTLSAYLLYAQRTA